MARAWAFCICNLSYSVGGAVDWSWASLKSAPAGLDKTCGACDEAYAVEPCLELGVCWGAEPCVVMKIEVVHLRCSYQPLWEFSRQLVIVQAEGYKVGEVSDLWGDGARELVVIQVELYKVGEVSDLGGDGARQLVFVQVEALKVGEVSDPCGDARQSVVSQAEDFKVGEVSDLWGDGRQSVVSQVEALKVGEVSDLCGDGAREAAQVEVG